MGQAEVYNAIRALGGQATYSQIKDYLCARGYCENSIHTPLRRLKNNGSVRVKPFGRLPVYVIPPATTADHGDGTVMTAAATAAIQSPSPSPSPSSR
ncbi:MAG TPA: hypothetical protein VNI77_08270 [Nitrososphaera sp.]|nr:hypothetical protein [Nitrososphaera sp.]